MAVVWSEATVRLISKRGVEALSVSSLAREMGVKQRFAAGSDREADADIAAAVA